MGDYDHYERHEAMESADDELQAARARIAELEATLARVHELPALWHARREEFPATEAGCRRCAEELEAVLVRRP